MNYKTHLDLDLAYIKAHSVFFKDYSYEYLKGILSSFYEAKQVWFDTVKLCDERLISQYGENILGIEIKYAKPSYRAMYDFAHSINNDIEIVLYNKLARKNNVNPDAWITATKRVIKNVATLRKLYNATLKG